MQTPDVGDSRMTRRYIGVVVLEAIIILLLWIVGRIYS
jgi:hypothetical protein